MTTAELLLQDFDIEMATTRRVLDRVPEGKPEYKCHDKSMPLGKLAIHVASLPFFGRTILTTPGMDMSLPNQFPEHTFESREATLALFHSAVKHVREALAACTDEYLAEIWKFSFGERVITAQPRSLAYRQFFFNHMLHHRAQLSVYLRLNDIPVPQIYGPSADEPFKPGN